MILALGIIANALMGVCEIVVDLQKINVARQPHLPTTQPTKKSAVGEDDHKSEEKPKSNPDDRTAAEYVQRVGGTGKVKQENDDIVSINEMPDKGKVILMKADLLNKNVDDKGLKLFERCKNLTWIRLDGCKAVTNDGIANLKNCKNLTYLGLGNTKVTDDGLEVFKDCKDITYLGLFETDTSVKGIKHFEKCEKLSEAQLGLTNLNDEGLKVLLNFNGLKELDLIGTDLSDEGLLTLAKLTKLKKLNLTKTKVTDSGIAKLRKELPDCKITTQDWLNDG